MEKQSLSYKLSKSIKSAIIWFDNCFAGGAATGKGFSD